MAFRGFPLRNPQQVILKTLKRPLNGRKTLAAIYSTETEV